MMVCVLSCVVTASTAPARAASLLPTGKPAPRLTLPTLSGKTVRTTEFGGRVVLLLFGELYNPNSIAACKDLAAILARPAMTDIKTSAFLVVTQKAPAAELLAKAKQVGVALPILHDDGRRAFTACRVMVLPSLVVIDGNGMIALSCAGYPMDFQDMVADSIFLAVGRLSAEQFGHRRNTTTLPTAPEAHIRAVRLAALGEQLARRGSDELAITKFKDAIALNADCIPARTGLGTRLLSRGRLAEAERHFLHVLRIRPDSVEAALGLIHVQVARGGSDLKLADERLRTLLRRRPNDPKVVYLAGLVAEKSGDPSAALGRYKRAAELLLYGQQRRWQLK